MDCSTFFIGQADLIVSDGCYTPVRFTQAQIDRMSSSNYPPEIGVRICNTSGVRMEFITDSPEISFSFTCDNFARAHVVFDIYENNEYKQSIAFEDNTTDGEVIYKKCTQEKATITIWLPHLVRTKIYDISIGNAVPNPKNNNLILFYGDSLTQGMTAPRPSFSWASIVAEELNMDVRNFGIGGKKFNPDVLDVEKFYRPQKLVVAYGINDSIQEQDMPRMHTAVPEFFRRFDSIYHGCEVYVITAPRIDTLCTSSTVSDNLDEVRKLTLIQAQKYGYNVVDGLELLPCEDRYIADDAHPNELGCAHIAQGLLRAIRAEK